MKFPLPYFLNKDQKSETIPRALTTNEKTMVHKHFWLISPPGHMTSSLYAFASASSYFCTEESRHFMFVFSPPLFLTVTKKKGKGGGGRSCLFPFYLQMGACCPPFFLPSPLSFARLLHACPSILTISLPLVTLFLTTMQKNTRGDEYMVSGVMPLANYLFLPVIKRSPRLSV